MYRIQRTVSLRNETHSTALMFAQHSTHVTLWIGAPRVWQLELENTAACQEDKDAFSVVNRDLERTYGSQWGNDAEEFED